MKRYVSLAVAATVSTAALLAAGTASASSFAIRSGQSAEGLGMAYAGAASGGIGMGAMAWNPATMTMFPGRNSQWNFTYLKAFGDYQPTAVTRLGSPVGPPSTALGGSPLGTGDLGGDGAFIPASYTSWQLSDRFWLGFTTGAPYGLRSKAENTYHAGQVYGRSAKVRSINVSPSLAYQVNDWLAIGAAFQIQYLKANLKTATGATIASAIGPTAANQILDGDTVDFGLRFGATLTPMKGTTIGLAYRSSIQQTLEGTLRTPAGVLPIKANLNLPDSVVFGLSQEINDRWQAHLGVEWTNWSRFRRIPIVSELTGTPVSSLNFVYDDSWYFSGGVEYKYSDALTLRAGAAYELSAVNDTNRTVFISDNDRLWLSAGASYQMTDKLKLDLGYTYIHVTKASVNYTGAHPQQGPVFYQAEAKPYIHIVSAGLTYRWDNPAQPIPVQQPLVVKY